MRSSSRGSQRPDIAAGITDWTNLLDPSKWTYEELKTFLVKYGGQGKKTSWSKQDKPMWWGEKYSYMPPPASLNKAMGKGLDKPALIDLTKSCIAYKRKKGSSDEAGEATAADVLAVPAMRGLEAGGSRDVDPETTVSSGADAGPPVAEGTEEQEPHEEDTSHVTVHHTPIFTDTQQASVKMAPIISTVEVENASIQLLPVSLSTPEPITIGLPVSTPPDTAKNVSRDQGIVKTYDQLKPRKCTDSSCNCKRYHCPLCPPKLMRPTTLHKARAHIDVHWDKKLAYKDVFIVKCANNCSDSLRSNFHWHCPDCDWVQSRRQRLIMHLLNVHSYKINESELKEIDEEEEEQEAEDEMRRIEEEVLEKTRPLAAAARKLPWREVFLVVSAVIMDAMEYLGHVIEDYVKKSGAARPLSLRVHEEGLWCVLQGSWLQMRAAYRNCSSAAAAASASSLILSSQFQVFHTLAAVVAPDILDLIPCGPHVFFNNLKKQHPGLNFSVTTDSWCVVHGSWYNLVAVENALQKAASHVKPVLQTSRALGRPTLYRKDVPEEHDSDPQKMDEKEQVSNSEPEENSSAMQLTAEDSSAPEGTPSTMVQTVEESASAVALSIKQGTSLLKHNIALSAGAMSESVTTSDNNEREEISQGSGELSDSNDKEKVSDCSDDAIEPSGKENVISRDCWTEAMGDLVKVEQNEENGAFTISINLPSSPPKNLRRNAESQSNNFCPPSERTCPMCNKVLRTKNLLSSHVRRQICMDGALFKCKDCDYTTRVSRDLKIHMSRLHQEKLFPCKLCPKRFGYELDLRRHVLEHHRQIRPMRRYSSCPICGATMHQKNMKSHIRRTHHKERLYECNICHKKFSTSNSLKVHTQLHFGGRKRTHLCPHCGKGFFRNSQLQDHLNAHTGKRPFVCTVCGKGFSYRTALNKHMPVHSDDRHHKCPTCSKTFKTAIYLRKHLAVHAETQRRFVCGICGKMYSSKHNLLLHQAKICSKLTGSTAIATATTTASGEGLPDLASMANLAAGMRLEIGDEVQFAVDPTTQQLVITTAQAEEGEGQAALEQIIEGATTTVEEGGVVAEEEGMEMVEQAEVETSQQRYMCGYCQKIFLDLEAVQEHMNQHSSDSLQIADTDLEAAVNALASLS